MFFSLTVGFYADAYALSGYTDKVLTKNVNEIISETVTVTIKVK